MSELLQKIEAAYAVFRDESAGSSKAAEKRARVASVDLRKLLKEYRELSLGKSGTAEG